MRWPDERYVRVYTRDTGEWLALGWEAQALFLFALRKSDRAGIVHTGKAGARGLAGMTGVPLDVVSRALPLLLDDGCMRETDGGYIIPNFIAAQEVPISDAQRKRDQRERDRDKALASGGPSQKVVADFMATASRMMVTPDVTQGGHAMASPVLSRPEVTTGHAGEVTPNRAVPSRSEPSSASQEPADAVPDASGFALEAQDPPQRGRKKRTSSAAEDLFKNLQAMREERCAEVGEPVVREEWTFARQNKDLGPLCKATPEEQDRFSDAYMLYLADDGQRVREPAWSLSYFMSPGVRARYETRAAREDAA